MREYIAAEQGVVELQAIAEDARFMPAAGVRNQGIAIRSWPIWNPESEHMPGS